MGNGVGAGRAAFVGEFGDENHANQPGHIERAGFPHAVVRLHDAAVPEDFAPRFFSNDLAPHAAASLHQPIDADAQFERAGGNRQVESQFAVRMGHQAEVRLTIDRREQSP